MYKKQFKFAILLITYYIVLRFVEGDFLRMTDSSSFSHMYQLCWDPESELVFFFLSTIVKIQKIIFHVYSTMMQALKYSDHTNKIRSM